MFYKEIFVSLKSNNFFIIYRLDQKITKIIKVVFKVNYNKVCNVAINKTRFKMFWVLN